MIPLLCFSSPQGLRFRSRASLHAFLLENPDGNLDINLFDFTASKSDTVADVSRAGGKTRAKKKPPDRSQEASTEILDGPPCGRDSSTVGAPGDEDDEASAGPCQVESDAAPVKIQPVTEAESAPGQRSPQRAASLREKLLKLVPAGSQQNSSAAAGAERAAASQPPSVEPAAESEKEEEAAQIRRGGDDGSNSDRDAVANGGCDVEEVLLPEVTAARESQNSKYQLHADSSPNQKFLLNLNFFFPPLFFKFFALNCSLEATTFRSSTIVRLDCRGTGFCMIPNLSPQ